MNVHNLRGSERLEKIAKHPWFPAGDASATDSAIRASFASGGEELWGSLDVSRLAEWWLEFLVDPRPTSWVSAASDVLYRIYNAGYGKPGYFDHAKATKHLAVAWEQYNAIRAKLAQATLPDDASAHRRAWAARAPGIVRFLDALLTPMRPASIP